jgi:biopolymer transport protein ExbD
MHRVAMVVVVVGAAACSKGQPDDCVVVREKPASAMAELSSRYPNNPVKVAEIIERCVAPKGEECDRIAKIIAAIPALAPQLEAPNADIAKTCKNAPPEFRRCLLPSYSLAHRDECHHILIDKILLNEVKVVPGDTPARAATGDDCGFVAIYVDKAGTWLATGRDEKARCFAPRKNGALDTEWLEAALRKAKAHECGPSSAEIAAANDVPYRDVITAMDFAVKVGFMDTGLSSPAELSVPLASASPKGAASECPPTLIEPDATDAAAAGSSTHPTPASGSDKLKNAPVLVITKDVLTLNAGGTSTEIAKLADARSASKLDALTKALPPTRDGMMILQADESTPSSVINAVITTAKSAGYDNVLFAVKNR